MSFNVDELKLLDQRTHNIVSGYIRLNQYILLSYHNNSNNYNIPKLIIYIILSYVSYHFMMNFGSYKWIISDNKIISAMKSCKNGEKFISEIFEIAKLHWRIEAYPNGYHKDSIGSFKLYVKLLSLPDNWKNIIVARTTECIQSMSKVSNICTYKKDESYGWTTGSLLLSEIKSNNYRSLTFIITIKILRINLIENNRIYYQYQFDRKCSKKKFKLVWNISSLLMSSMKKSNVGKKYESRIYNNLWCLQCCPNGRNTKSSGDVRIYLQLCSLPYNISKLYIQWEIICIQTATRDINTKIFNYNSTWVKTENSLLSFDTLKTFQNLTIISNITILNEYDLNGNDITIKQKENDWNNYIKEINENKQITKKLHINNNKFVKINQKLKLLQNNIDDIKLSIQDLSRKVVKINNYIDNNNNLQQEDDEKDNILTTTCTNNNNNNNNDIMKEIILLRQQMNTFLHNNKFSNNSINISSEEKVKLWFKNTVNLIQYYDCFIENGFDDLDIIKSINIDQLDTIGIKKLGHKMKIMQKINILNGTTQ